MQLHLSVDDEYECQILSTIYNDIYHDIYIYMICIYIMIQYIYIYIYDIYIYIYICIYVYVRVCVCVSVCEAKHRAVINFSFLVVSERMGVKSQ